MDNSSANYLTSFKVLIIRHIRETMTFSDTAGLTKEEMLEAVAALVNRAVPLPQASFDWLRTILRFVKDRDQWFTYDNTTGLWHYEVSDNQLRSVLCDYFQALHDEAVRAGDMVYARYASAFFQDSRLSGLMRKLKGAIQFVEPSAASIIENTYNLRYFETVDGKRVMIDLSQDTWNIREVRFSDTQPLMFQHMARQRIDVDNYEEPKLFLSLIEDYMMHDAEKIAYFKRVLAYMMMPYNQNQVLLYWVGSEGRNGKSTILKVFQDILGSYVTRLSSDVINANPATSFKRDDAYASMEGKSLLVFNEIDERMVASTQNIKEMTEGGRDEYGNMVYMTVRPAYSRSYDVNVSGTPLIVANSLINMGEWSNLAPIFKRLILISFDYRIVNEDPTIASRLAEEYPRIQAWLYLNYFEHKEKLPDGKSTVVLKGKKRPADWERLFVQYHDDSDIIKMFWHECIHTVNDRNVRLQRSMLYKAYEIYCRANGRKPIKNKGTNGFSNLIRPYIEGSEILANGTYYVTGAELSDYYRNEVSV